jgi:hypothetical protein
VENYSLVKDQRGNVCGVWYRNPALARDKAALSANLSMLSIKDSLPMDLFILIQQGKYHVTQNFIDNRGGFFVWFVPLSETIEKKVRDLDKETTSDS